jgi:hypothetical protein
MSGYAQKIILFVFNRSVRHNAIQRLHQHNNQSSGEGYRPDKAVRGWKI